MTIKLVGGEVSFRGVVGSFLPGFKVGLMRWDEILRRVKAAGGFEIFFVVREIF